MEFGIEKCDMLIMKSGERETMAEIKLQILERIIMFGEKENYKCLGILEADTIKQMEMKEKTKNEYLR